MAHERHSADTARPAPPTTPIQKMSAVAVSPSNRCFGRLDLACQRGWISSGVSGTITGGKASCDAVWGIPTREATASPPNRRPTHSGRRSPTQPISGGRRGRRTGHGKFESVLSARHGRAVATAIVSKGGVRRKHDDIGKTACGTWPDRRSAMLWDFRGGRTCTPGCTSGKSVTRVRKLLTKLLAGDGGCDKCMFVHSS